MLTYTLKYAIIIIVLKIPLFKESGQKGLKPGGKLMSTSYKPFRTALPILAFLLTLIVGSSLMTPPTHKVKHGKAPVKPAVYTLGGDKNI